jgi:hypothetical protein
VGRISGDLYLAYRALFVQPLRRLFAGGPRGKARFLAHFAPEGLVPTTSADRAMIAAAGRCISCGLCDELDGQLGTLAGYDGASLLPRQYARSSVEIRHARAAIERIDPQGYAAAEAACPTRVPLVALAVWLKERLARSLGAGA